MIDKSHAIVDFVAARNAEKFLFTAGPAALLPENVVGLRPCFGRGDADYAEVEKSVMSALSKLSGHATVVRMQGSASLALEIMVLNFLFGRVLLVHSGYYSDRMYLLSNCAKRQYGRIREVISVGWDCLDDVSGSYDWVVACYTETSCGLRLSVEKLRAVADRLSAKLMLDATASIGLEPHHELGDVIAYSSCKGLFGLTGAAFIACHESPTVEVDSFYLSFASHIEKKMTGPYHAIASLAGVLEDHDSFRSAVVENKARFMQKLEKYLTRPADQQPQLCTHVSCKISSNDSRAILYAPRSESGGSVVCHLGEVHRGRAANGAILDLLEIAP